MYSDDRDPKLWIKRIQEATDDLEIKALEDRITTRIDSCLASNASPASPKTIAEILQLANEWAGLKDRRSDEFNFDESFD